MGNDINTYIEFAATDGKIATDDGLFARHLSAELARPGLGVEAVFRNVRERVATETKQAQVPISFSQLSGQVNFFFVAPAASGSDPLALLERTAAAMAQGAVGSSNAHVAISVTGIAGPTGAVPGKPVGTVCFGWANADTVHTERLVFSGDRHAVRQQTIEHALKGLLRFIN